MSGGTLEIFGRRLQEARRRMGATQEELAEEMGVSPLTVCFWETGRRTPKACRLPELAFYVGTSIDWLLGYEREGVCPHCGAKMDNIEEKEPTE